MVRENKARVFSANPFIIQMYGEHGEIAMKKREFSSIISFQKFFKEDNDVYVRNTSNTQVSITFYEEGGRASPLTIGIDKKKRPMNLTQYVSLDAIRKSTDLRALANREPPVIELMTEEEYVKFFEKLANQRKTDLDVEIREANQFHSRVINKQPDLESEVRSKKPAKELIEDKRREEEEVETTVAPQPLPRVAYILSQVNEEIPKDERMKAVDILDELENLKDKLTEVDIQMLQQAIYFKTVRTFLAKKLEELAG